jgi:DNA repair exonuclease SbcCD ATPase subunit
MIIKSIELENINNFEGKHLFSFDKLNLIAGDNGVGKTTLALSSILFTLYGQLEKNLSDFITKGKDKGQITVVLEYLDIEYKIIRKYPTSIQIFKNNIELELSTNREKQKYINELLGDIENFRKFRMIDTKKGISLLESGETSLKQTLFSINEELFNIARRNLLEIKRIREIFNKDKAVIYSFYPSENRLNVLNEGKNSLSPVLSKLEGNIRVKELDYSEIYGKYNQRKGLLNHNNSELEYVYNLNEKGKCPSCKQVVNRSIISQMIEDLEGKINVLNGSIGEYEKELGVYSNEISELKQERDRIREKKNKLETLILKLKGRLKQKEYCYSNKDIVIVKQAISELDSFGSYYLMRWLLSLEPIMNSIVEKIGFKIKFEVNDNGKFNLILIKDNNEYFYKDLSLGQGLIVNIAFQLSILLKKGETGLIIADEGFTSLSEKNLKVVFELFQDLPFQLFCVLHRFSGHILGMNIVKLGED